MTEGLRMVKKEFGNDAVILSAKTLQKTGRFLGTVKQAGVIITAATDPIQTGLNKKLKSYANTGHVTSALSDKTDAQGLSSKTDAFLDALGSDRHQEPCRPPHSSGVHAIPGVEIRKTLNLIKGRLLSQGVENPIAKEVIGEIEQRLPTAGSPSSLALKRTFSEFIRQRHLIADPIHRAGKTPLTIALVGPTGVGKTTTTVKLAVQYKLEMNYRVGIITLDHYRIAATAALMTYSNITDIPCEIVSNAGELRQALKSMKKMDLIMIDTPGVGLNDKPELNRVAGLLDKVSPDQVYLVLASMTKNADMLAYHHYFESTGFDRLIFSKLDETSVYGNIFNLLIKMNTPVAYLTGGQTIPENIRPVTIDTLLDLILPESVLVDNTVQGRVLSRTRHIKTPAEKTVPEYEFVANRNSDIFHHNECKSVSRIHRDNIIHFSNITEAMEQNFKPCRMCCMENIDPKLVMKPLKRAAQGRY